MKKKSFIAMLLMALLVFNFASAQSKTVSKSMEIKTKNITYTIGNQNFKGYLVWKEGGKAQKPGILLVHEWWGFNEYIRMRAEMLAKLGYTVLAVDMYGEGKVYESATEAQQAAGFIFSHPDILKESIWK
jgi:dienelactone hydrolase